MQPTDTEQIKQANKETHSHLQPQPRYVRIKEAPKYIDRKIGTLRNWRNEGIYPTIFFKFGGLVYVDLEEYERVINKQIAENKKTARRLGLVD